MATQLQLQLPNRIGRAEVAYRLVFPVKNESEEKFIAIRRSRGCQATKTRSNLRERNPSIRTFNQNKIKITATSASVRVLGVELGAEVGHALHKVRRVRIGVCSRGCALCAKRRSELGRLLG